MIICAMLNEERLIDILFTINPWWKNLPVPPSIKKSEGRRKVFYEIVKYAIEDNRVLSLSGPRQVGKTTLMGQLIDYQIKEKGVVPKRIFYLPVDNELVRVNSDNILMDCMRIFVDTLLGEQIDQLKNKVYVYLDEIQAMKDWSKSIKTYLDAYPNIKFVMAGSSQTKLHIDASESLVGRILYRIMLPFKFREFIEYHLAQRSETLDFSAGQLRGAFQASLKQETPQVLYNAVKRLKIELVNELPEIKKLLNVYLIKGGYPGILGYHEEYDRSVQRLKTDLELTVYKDIHKIFNTRNSDEIMNLLTLLATSSGQKINYTKLSNSLGIDRRVLANYLGYLRLLYLSIESPFYKQNRYKRVEKMDKVYLVDTGHRNVLLGKMSKELTIDQSFGLVIQTAVFNHASRLKSFLTNYVDYEINYWEEGGYEVDVIIDLQTTITPIEVKSTNGKKGIPAVKKFIQEHQKRSKWGIVITREECELQENILLMPLWAFMLMC